MKSYIVIFFLMSAISLFGQPTIYNDGGTLVTGTWNGQGVINDTTINNPYEGNKHYMFQYNYTAWWAGFGLNLDTWGDSLARDFSGYQYLRLAYRGLSGAETFNINLKSGTAESASVIIGSSVGEYTQVYIPMASFTGVDLTQITEIVCFVTGVEVASGTVYIDDLVLTNQGAPPYDGSNANHTSPETWLRFGKMGKGINFSNWLEAYWLLPNNFPEPNRFNRAKTQDLVNLGFKNFRLPVTFERLAGGAPNYIVPPNHVVWSLIDSAIVWAEEMDFTLIICNHHGYELTNANYSTELARKRAIWNQVMTRYSALDPERYFLELFNEPTVTINNANLHTVFDSIISTVRSYNTDHTLVIGGNGWNSNIGLTSSMTYNDPNIIYTYHDYNPYAFSHQGLSWTTPPYLPARAFPLSGSTDSADLVNGLLAVQTWADTSGVPVMLGEFGASTAADATSRCNWINAIAGAFSSRSMPWYYWDATTINDAFGFINAANVPITCFASAFKVGAFNTCDKLISNANEYGVGSIREQIGCAAEGDTIRFASGLIGDTIYLDASPILLGKNITLENNTNGDIYISSEFNSSLILIDTEKQLNLINLNLLPKITTPFYNLGVMKLTDTNITMPEGVELMNKGVIEVRGSSIVR